MHPLLRWMHPSPGMCTLRYVCPALGCVICTPSAFPEHVTTDMETSPDCYEGADPIRTCVKFVVNFIEPISDTIHCTDTNSPCFGEIYEQIDSKCEMIKSIIITELPTYIHNYNNLYMGGGTN
jgi:hypothetical protein